MRKADLEAVRAVPIESIIGQRVKLRRAGQDYIGCCPFHDDQTPSFHVYTGTNRFWCFGCGAGGNGIDFVMQYEGVGFLDAVEIIGSGAALTAQPRRVTKAPKVSDKRGFALNIWNAAVQVEGTIAESYLGHRGLPLADLPRPLPIRFDYLEHPATKQRHPTLISAVCDLNRDLTGIQRTFLTPDGLKLPGVNAKLSLGSIRGNATQLGQASDEIIVCEGLEDGLSVRLGLPNIPVWVAAGAGNVAAMLLPHQCRKVTIAADNDEAGRRAADEAASVFQRAGRIARIMYPSSPHKDFNEQVQAQLA